MKTVLIPWHIIFFKWFLWGEIMPHSPSRAPPGGKPECGSGGSHLDDGLQPSPPTLSPHSPNLHYTSVFLPSDPTKTGHASPSCDWLSYMCTLILTYLNLPPSSPLGPATPRRPSLSAPSQTIDHHTLSILPPKYLQNPSGALQFRAAIDPPHSTLSGLEVLAQVIHLDRTGLKLNNTHSQDGGVFHDPKARLEPSAINSHWTLCFLGHEHWSHLWSPV